MSKLLAYARKLKQPGKVFRRVRNRLSPSVVVLLYHRVAEVDLQPVRLAVTPQHFSEHMDVLRKQSLPISAQAMVRRLSCRRLPRRAVVVTFDDGYLDNLVNAKPVLEQFDVPATVFTVSDCVQRDRGFWWDDLERILLRAGKLPSRLSISTGGSMHCWELNDSAEYSEDDFRRYRAWKLEDVYEPTLRHKLYRSLHSLLRSSPPVQRDALLSQVLDWAGAVSERGDDSRPMSSEEIIELADGGLVDIGSHTATHSNLSLLPIDAQRQEIRGSRSALESILGRKVRTFAYPFGFPASDYTDETVNEVRAAGYSYAFSAFPGAVRASADVFQLPRIWVDDWNGDEFERHLSGWFLR